MVNECQKFKTSRTGLYEFKPGCLNTFFRRIAPDEQFRFITFQDNDYRLGNLTILLFNYVPDTVFVTVETPLDIEDALDELATFNTGVCWDYGTLNYFDSVYKDRCCITVELRLTSVPMRVGGNGLLIGFI